MGSSAGGNKVLEEQISPEKFQKEIEVLQKIGSPGIEGKMYTVDLVLGFWTENGVSFLEKIRNRFLPAIGCI